MAQIVTKYAAKKLLGSQMDKYKHKDVAGDDDPYFTTIPDRHGKPRKVKKQIPPFIPDHDASVLARAKKRAYHLDMSLFTLFGLRFGWSSVIGLIPELGDIIDLFFAIKLVQMCQGVDGGLPQAVVSKMWFNVAIDFVLGLVPILGDLADASWRCNTKNVGLLERHLREKHGKGLSKEEKRRSGLEVFPADAGMIPGLEGVGVGEDGGQRHAQYGTAGQSQGMQPPSVQQAQRQQEQQQKQSRGWFGFGGKNKTQQDVERGQETGTV